MDGATVIVHVPPELLLWLEREAVAAGRTRNDEVVALLELGRMHTERLREGESPLSAEHAGPHPCKAPDDDEATA